MSVCARPCDDTVLRCTVCSLYVVSMHLDWTALFICIANQRLVGMALGMMPRSWSICILIV
jgi:hypothetical protein